MTYRLITQDAPPLIEDPRAQWRRRLRQHRCLVCGSPDLHYHSVFCAPHRISHRWCAPCETLRAAEEHGPDRYTCRTCSSRQWSQWRKNNPEADRYARVLRQMAERRSTLGDAVLGTAARRVALAELVRRTRGATWAERARLCGYTGDWRALRAAYVRQCRGDLHDPDWRGSI